MRLAIAMVLGGCVLAGCTVMDNQVKMDELAKPTPAFLVDKTGTVQFAEVNGPGEARDQEAWKKALAAV